MADIAKNRVVDYTSLGSLLDASRSMDFEVRERLGSPENFINWWRAWELGAIENKWSGKPDNKYLVGGKEVPEEAKYLGSEGEKDTFIGQLDSNVKEFGISIATIYGDVPRPYYEAVLERPLVEVQLFGEVIDSVKKLRCLMTRSYNGLCTSDKLKFSEDLASYLRKLGNRFYGTTCKDIGISPSPQWLTIKRDSPLKVEYRISIDHEEFWTHVNNWKSIEADGLRELYRRFDSREPNLENLEVRNHLKQGFGGERGTKTPLVRLDFNKELDLAVRGNWGEAFRYISERHILLCSEIDKDLIEDLRRLHLENVMETR